ncbi:hypothetical protein [Candidatus Steffania adelgidicola]|uniref:hypothetical protein n=1 Tax=Candidatus Steffania adelgidicola TaxID=1076626 RepID=UPI001D008F1B
MKRFSEIYPRGDCYLLVGVNLLRKRLDVPKALLIAILYSDKITQLTVLAIGETECRRKKQNTYNLDIGITYIVSAINKEIPDIVPQYKLSRYLNYKS